MRQPRAVAAEVRHSSSPQDTAQLECRERLDRIASEIERLLKNLLGPDAVGGEQARPKRLIDAMRYAALEGGKRFRPFLVVESASLFDVDRGHALMAAAALECVHCYSLIHDDLPAMDDDALRRGRPTVHKAFDEATAILAGDALLTLAFDVMSRPQTHPDPNVRIELVSALARAAGVGGMAGGQMLDLAAEGRYSSAAPTLDAAAVTLLQSMKTGALIRFACAAGAILGGGQPAHRAALDQFGTALGEAFQIADDFLDLHGDPKIVGKATGKDAVAHKATFISTLGVDGAHRRLSLLVDTAQSALDIFGARADVLRAAVEFVATRRS